MDDEERIYYDEELYMCRECLLLVCDMRYCYRATMKAALGGMAKEMKTVDASAYGVAGSLFQDNMNLEESK